MIGFSLRSYCFSFVFFVFFSFLSSPPFFSFHPWDGAFVESKIDKGR